MGEHAAVNRSVDSSSLPGAAKSTKSELFILRWIVRILLSLTAKITIMSAKKQEIEHCPISCFLYLIMFGLVLLLVPRAGFSIPRNLFALLR